jgi:hypothetical protein
MSFIRAGYYMDEIFDWLNTIDYCNEEKDEIEKKLEEVIGRNSIIGISQKVEHQQDLFDKQFKAFSLIVLEIKYQEKRLKIKDELIADDLITGEIEIQQSALRERMKLAEKKFIDLKFGCYDFLSGTLKK